MNTRLSQIGVVAVVVLGALVLGWPVRTQAASLAVSAGGQNAPAKQRFQNLAAELQLTDQQKQQLKPIFRDEAQKLKNLRAQTGLSRRQKHAQLNQIRQDLLARAKPILTPAQLQKWQELRAQQRSWRHTSSQPPAPGL